MAWEKETNILSLLDEEFLAVLLEEKHRTLYAKLAALDINELPIETIEGKVTGGSINLDGDSCVRRTCSLTMIADEVNISDYYWGLNTKFRLEIGVVNHIIDSKYAAAASDYPEIVWFPQGTYLISSFNTSLSVNGYTISISGKDKMCMLNGDLGGQLFASIDFGTEEFQATKMHVVETTNVTTSEQLMLNKYYIEYTGNQNNILIDKIYDENNNQVPYKFIEDNQNGTYYKFGNVYKLLSSFTGKYIGTKYKCYQLATSPDDLFKVAIGTETQKFEQVTGQTTLYRLNNSGTYCLKTLYEIDYEYTKKQIPLEKIIRESVHAYAKEPYHNIIINDLDKYGLEQITYKGDLPLLAFRDATTGHFLNIAYADQFINNTIIDNIALSSLIHLNKAKTEIIVSKINNVPQFYLDNLSNNPSESPTIFYSYLQTNGNNSQIIYSFNPPQSGTYKTYTIAPIYYGTDIGYRAVDLVYNGDLISGIGETLTSVLDKIKNMLGDFEYFYDTDGRFIFQKKKTYVNTAWSQIANNTDEKYITFSNEHSKFSFNFEGNRLITAVQNTPVLTNLKNDYVVWGKRKTLTGGEVPIHARYAIDRRPTEYMAFNGTLYITDEARFDPSDQYRELILEQTVTAVHAKNVSIIPDCLIEADPAVQDETTLTDKKAKTLWYEIQDWAQTYYELTGAYPKQRMMRYQQTGFKETVTFDDGRTINFNEYGGQLIIDFRAFDGDTQINTAHMLPYYQASPFQHRYNGCGHTYTDFLNRYETFPGMRSFIYNPIMPEDVIHDDGGATNNALDDVISTMEKKKLVVDWRELIYQMAMDYFAAQGCDAEHPIYSNTGKVMLSDPDDFLFLVGQLNIDKYPNGYTGYEQYYTDMQGFWRQLYNPYYQPQLVYAPGSYEITVNKSQTSNFYTKTKEWKDASITDIIFDYYSLQDTISNVTIDEIYEFNGEYHTSNNALSGLVNFSEGSNKLYKLNGKLYNNKMEPLNKMEYIVEKNDYKLYWNVNVFKNPELLNFWIDFLDEGEELAKFSILQVGDRQKVINDDKVSAIIFKEIPDLILYEKRTNDLSKDIDYREAYEEQTGYTWIYLPKGFSQYLNISYRNLSAKDKIDQLLYQHAYCIENVSITALPIYHLQPNTRIYVCDKNTGVNGEYIVSKISLPLTYNGTMSITASLAPQRLL